MTPLLIAAAIVAGQFAIAGERFAPAEILDARAMPELDGSASVMISFAPAAAKRLATLTKGKVGQPLALTLDGKPLTTPTVREPIETGVVMITDHYTIAQAEDLAKRISGKEPLPEEFGE